MLVIDDDPASRDLLRRHLEAEGVRVVAAAGGEEGLRLARQLRPALVTLDVLMPGLDGWAVLGALKGDPATADIPVVVLTLLDDRDLGYALGAADYLTKPIERERLLAAVRKHVRRDHRRGWQRDAPGARRGGRPGHARDAAADAPARGLGRGRGRRTGASAWSAWRVAAPDLILLDLMMPELDGFGFVERLRAEPAWRTIPVLVVTAKDLTPGGAAETERLGGAGAPEGGVLTRRAARRGAGAGASIGRPRGRSTVPSGQRPDALKRWPATGRPEEGDDGEDPPGRGQRDEP